ncbi:MAG: dephospho-CoA kinase/protein folding accessory protein [Actinomycetota bacterium]
MTSQRPSTQGHLRIGLTGGIGSGKSTVAALLADYGALVIDADAVAREVVAPGTEGLAALVAEFGGGVLAPDGSLDRPALAAIAFADEAARARLNAVLHPRIAARTVELRSAAAPGQVIVHDVPLLVENGLAPAYDAVIVVAAPLDVRLTRLAQRGVPPADARRRIAAQATDEQRHAVADLVIDNGSDLDALAEQVARTWKALTDQPAG